ncbi:hypothetical protein GCM10020255_061430 [Rhodococcus baikonurensis]
MSIREAVSVDGTSIVYRVTGNSAGTPLVLLHGWAQSSQCWGEQVLADLAADYRLIAVDLRGHGYSDAPESGYDDSANWAATSRLFLRPKASPRTRSCSAGRTAVW